MARQAGHIAQTDARCGTTAQITANGQLGRARGAHCCAQIHIAAHLGCEWASAQINDFTGCAVHSGVHHQIATHFQVQRQVRWYSPRDPKRAAHLQGEAAQAGRADVAQNHITGNQHIVQSVHIGRCDGGHTRGGQDRFTPTGFVVGARADKSPCCGTDEATGHQGNLPDQAAHSHQGAVVAQVDRVVSDQIHRHAIGHFQCGLPLQTALGGDLDAPVHQGLQSAQGQARVLPPTVTVREDQITLTCQGLQTVRSHLHGVDALRGLHAQAASEHQRIACQVQAIGNHHTARLGLQQHTACLRRNAVGQPLRQTGDPVTRLHTGQLQLGVGHHRDGPPLGAQQRIGAHQDAVAGRADADCATASGTQRGTDVRELVGRVDRDATGAGLNAQVFANGRRREHIQPSGTDVHPTGTACAQARHGFVKQKAPVGHAGGADLGESHIVQAIDFQDFSFFQTDIACGGLCSDLVDAGGQ